MVSLAALLTAMMLVVCALFSVALHFVHACLTEKNCENEETIVWNQDLTSRRQLGEIDETIFHVRQSAEHKT